MNAQTYGKVAKNWEDVYNFVLKTAITYKTKKRLTTTHIAIIVGH